MQLTIRMPDEYMRRIETLARRMGLKKSDVARMAIKEFIANHSGRDDNYPYARAKHLLGVAESGVEDLGRNHRKYILEKIKNKQELDGS